MCVMQNESLKLTSSESTALKLNISLYDIDLNDTNAKDDKAYLHSDMEEPNFITTFLQLLSFAPTVSPIPYWILANP